MALSMAPSMVLRFARPCALAGLSLGLACLLSAWARPSLPTTKNLIGDPEKKLRSAIIEVNGEPHVVLQGEELAVLRGDLVKLSRAELKDGSLIPGNQVHLVGFKHSRKAHNKAPTEAFQTHELSPKLSEDGKGEVYAVLVGDRGLMVGSVFLHLLNPVLRFVEISLNGKRLVLRDGEQVTMYREDQLKVERVVTNVAGNSGVQFQILQQAKGLFNLTFLRGEEIFAQVPLKVMD